MTTDNQKNGAVTTQTFAEKITANQKAIGALLADQTAMAAKVERATNAFGADDPITVDFVKDAAEIDEKLGKLRKQTTSLENAERVAEHVEPLIKRIGVIKAAFADVSGTISLATLETALQSSGEAMRKARARNDVLVAVARAVEAAKLDEGTRAAFPALAFESANDGAGVTVKATSGRTTSGEARGPRKPYVVSVSPSGGAAVGTVVGNVDGAQYATLADLVREVHADQAGRLQSSDSKARTSGRTILESIGYEFTAGEGADADDDEGATEGAESEAATEAVTA